MKFFLSLLIAVIFKNAIAQPVPEWFVYPGTPSDTRFDDIFFINDSVGWAVNSSGEIYKTINGSNGWELQESYFDYFRSVEFFDENVGFAGSLYGNLYKTINGGENWTNISGLLPEPFDGICGMSAADDSSIYACGIWHSPAFIFKSTDRGLSWEYIDMSDYAEDLVDIKFLDAMHGFATGTDANTSLGGVILYTDDGGSTWTPKVHSNYPYEYIWKIQFLDALNVYGSVEDNTATNDPRIVISHDGGMNWEIKTIADEYYNIEMIGFINVDTGWVGGWFDGAFETFDGGETWDMNYFGRNLNRFFKLNDNLAYASGETIYVYSDTTYVAPIDTTQDTIIDTTTTLIPNLNIPQAILDVFPNPSQNMISVSYAIERFTFIDLSIFDMNGKKVHNFYHDDINTGKYLATYEHNLPPGEYVVAMHSHEGFFWKKFVVN
ncbi:MAG: T9SS type A sorting domain-containing protein [Chitinophagales bacterium]